VTKVIERAAALLRSLANRSEPAGVNELARDIKLAPATVYRLLCALSVEGFVQQEADTTKYALGSEVIPLALNYLNRRRLGPDCLPVMRRLAHETGESVNLGILSSTNIYYVQQVEGPNPLRFGRDVGLSVPLYCSALGKLLFAQVPMNIRSDIMKKLLLERRTKQTITDKVKLAKELNIILAKGYAVDLEENIENLVGIAVPVRDVHGAVVAGLSVMGPSMRMTAPQRNRLLPKLLAAADSLSVQLGWQNDRTRTAGDV
jgi:IclR family transcriptional regulator, KDG regulon repressor